MKLREKLAIEHPEAVDSKCVGGCFGCPHDYGYENDAPEGCDYNTITCEKCWSREYNPNWMDEVSNEVDKVDANTSNETIYDPVNNPSHYTQGGIECIDAMISTFGKEAVRHFCLCNAFKYVWRTEHKNGAEDCKKAIWYLTKALELAGE